MSAYYDDSIGLDPTPARHGDTVHIKYHGLLKNSGADSVYLHYSNDGWNTPRTIPMDHSPEGGFAAEIKAEGGSEFDFCFKDSANNWDNNNGWNWKFNIA
jgi:hypothetical protein